MRRMDCTKPLKVSPQAAPPWDAPLIEDDAADLECFFEAV